MTGRRPDLDELRAEAEDIVDDEQGGGGIIGAGFISSALLVSFLEDCGHVGRTCFHAINLNVAPLFVRVVVLCWRNRAACLEQ